MKKQVEYLQRLFYDLWNDFGSVYLVVKNSDKTSIGGRGFTDQEKQQGLVLVFNDKTTNNTLNWDPDGNLSCQLAFGPRREDVFLYHDDLLGVFSPEAGVQFMRADIDREAAAAPETRASPSKPAPEQKENKQVVSIDNFRKRKPQEKK